MTTSVSLKAELDHLLNDFAARHYANDVSSLNAAVSYALLGPGKRIRGQMAWLTCEAFGKPRSLANAAAIALEMIHAYSLVHDDLPCLDNDDLRRGRATVHVAFDEPTALLAGDALLTDAFRVLADPAFAGVEANTDLSCNLVRFLSRAAGGHGMVAGQALDVHWTGRLGAGLSELEKIHKHKTGRLLGAAAAMGALCGGATFAQAEAFQSFGEDVGLSFQIIDDLLDEEEHTGKSKGKDKEQGKLTYVTLVGAQEARSLADNYTSRAMALLESFGKPALPLKELVSQLLLRKS